MLTTDPADVAKDSHALRKDVPVDVENGHLSVRKACKRDHKARGCGANKIRWEHVDHPTQHQGPYLVQCCCSTTVCVVDESPSTGWEE